VNEPNALAAARGAGVAQTHRGQRAKNPAPGSNLGKCSDESYRLLVRALVLDDAPRLREDLPIPERPPREARIELLVGGVCDTDLQLARGYMAFSGTLGHEFVGRVLEADSPAWVGRRVVADINAGCGHCPDCTTADGHHCQQRTVLGIAGRPGAFAEQLVAPESNLVEVVESVPNDQAVFAEPLAAALHVLDDPGVAAAPWVLVLGDGKLGLLTAMALVASGKPTHLVGRHPRKLAIAERAGVQTRLEADAAGLAPVVVEATGSPAGLQRAVELVEPRGTIVLKTTVAEPLALDLSRVVVNELRLVGSRCGNLARAIDLLAAELIDPRPLVDARYPLAQADAALEHAARRGALKVLIDGAR
jgi:2-desacetyl-2-hydroxyethyl bacteriochlorophyllide A dehydrogenase